MPKLCCICEYYTQNPANVSTKQTFSVRELSCQGKFRSGISWQTTSLAAAHASTWYMLGRRAEFEELAFGQCWEI